MENHFIYLHRNPKNNEVFYIGQGTKQKNLNTRAYSKRSRSKWWNNYILIYGFPIVEIIFEGLDQKSVDEIEIFLIKYIGRKDINEGTLVNLTDGGNGCGTRSTQYKKEHSIRMSGENHPMFGRKHSLEWRHNNSKSHIGKKPSEETRKKMSNSRKGGKRSEETRRKMSESLSGENNPMYGRTGEKNPSSKLNWEKVEEIRTLYKNGGQSLRKLAKTFSVSAYTIESILKNRTWKKIK